MSALVRNFSFFLKLTKLHFKREKHLIIKEKELWFLPIRIFFFVVVVA